MALLTSCPTKHGIILAGTSAALGPMRFPVCDPQLPGFLFAIDPSSAINEQILAVLSQRLARKVSGNDVVIEQRFSSPVELAEESLATLYLGVIQDAVEGPQDSVKWLTMPEILRQMPKDRNRLAYLRAWQVLTGALTESTKAVDILDILS